jgi:hypothetical protein
MTCALHERRCVLNSQGRHKAKSDNDRALRRNHCSSGSGMRQSTEVSSVAGGTVAPAGTSSAVEPGGSLSNTRAPEPSGRCWSEPLLPQL